MKAISTSGARFTGVMVAAVVLCAVALALTAVLRSPLPLFLPAAVIATLAFVILLIATGRGLIGRHRAILAEHDPLWEGMLAILIGFLAASISSCLFALPSAMIYFWALLALALRSDDGAPFPANAASAPVGPVPETQ